METKNYNVNNPTQINVGNQKNSVETIIDFLRTVNHSPEIVAKFINDSGNAFLKAFWTTITIVIPYMFMYLTIGIFVLATFGGASPYQVLSMLGEIIKLLLIDAPLKLGQDILFFLFIVGMSLLFLYHALTAITNHFYKKSSAENRKEIRDAMFKIHAASFIYSMLKEFNNDGKSKKEKS